MRNRDSRFYLRFTAIVVVQWCLISLTSGGNPTNVTFSLDPSSVNHLIYLGKTIQAKSVSAGLRQRKTLVGIRVSLYALYFTHCTKRELSKYHCCNNAAKQMKKCLWLFCDINPQVNVLRKQKNKSFKLM